MIDIETWRARIGTFGRVRGVGKSSQSRPPRGGSLFLLLLAALTSSTLNTVTFEVVTVIFFLLMLCGDVELNPGPKTSENPQIQFVLYMAVPNVCGCRDFSTVSTLYGVWFMLYPCKKLKLYHKYPKYHTLGKSIQFFSTASGAHKNRCYTHFCLSPSFVKDRVAEWLAQIRDASDAGLAR